VTAVVDARKTREPVIAFAARSVAKTVAKRLHMTTGAHKFAPRRMRLFSRRFHAVGREFFPANGQCPQTQIKLAQCLLIGCIAAIFCGDPFFGNRPRNVSCGGDAIYEKGGCDCLLALTPSKERGSGSLKKGFLDDAVS
jgi:hypothetical protein